MTGWVELKNVYTSQQRAHEGDDVAGGGGGVGEQLHGRRGEVQRSSARVGDLEGHRLLSRRGGEGGIVRLKIPEEVQPQVYEPGK